MVQPTLTDNVQIAQDDEGFEIASVRDSLDENDEADNRPPAYDRPPTTVNGDAGTKLSNANRGISPLPAPIPQRPPGSVQPPRESLDGETIFAVGEDGDKFSDDEGHEEERRGLTRKTS